MKKQFVKTAFLVAIFLMLPKFANATVLFEDNFDAQDWNTSGQYNEDGGIWTSEGVNLCTTAPTGWTNYYTLSGGSISAPSGGGHLGSSRAWIALYPTATYSGGSELSKTLDSDHSELYLRVWMKAKPGWFHSDSANIKVGRLTHFGKNGGAYDYFSDGFSAPMAGFNWSSSQSYYPNRATFIPWHRCDPQESYYQDCPGTYTDSIFNPPMPTRSRGTTLGGGISDWQFYTSSSGSATSAGNYADGDWHRWDFQVKMNTMGASNGLYKVWYDGNLILNDTTMQWVLSGSDGISGWNTVQLGGNNNNPGQSSEQWIAYDDVVISDAPIPADYVPGGEIGPDTTAPITTASPVGGTYSSTQTVTLTPNETATTKYCLGVGCNPTTTYSSPISISSSNTLRFYSTDTATNIESVKTEAYVIDAGMFTLGETAILSVSDTAGINNLFAQSITLTQTATINSLSAHITSPAGNIRMGIYDATGPSGGPGQLKASTPDTSSTGGWQTVNVTTPTSLSAGTYWLALLANSNSLYISQDAVGGPLKYYTFTYGALPTTFSTSPSSTAGHVSMYANLTTTPQGGDVMPPAAPTGLSVM